MFSATGLPYATISHPSAINIPRCHHIRVNGVQCGSPALKDRRLCYFHSRVRITRGSTNLPILEDINSVQHALMQVITALLAGKVDRQMAGLLLYGLQTASANSRHVNFAPLPYYVVRDLTGAVPHNEDEPPQSATQSDDAQSASEQPESGCPTPAGVDCVGSETAAEPVSAGESLAPSELDPLRHALRLAHAYVTNAGPNVPPARSRKKRPRAAKRNGALRPPNPPA